MIAVRKLAELQVSAASGLVRIGQRLLVVADDELHLDAYAADGAQRVGRIALPATKPLPEGEGRKRLKPDLESLVCLPGGRVLALGSGSTEQRRTGHLFEAPAGDELPEYRATCDLGPLYAHLLGQFAELNVEGAAAAAGRLRLLQRGNGARGQNAVIDLALDGVLEALAAGRPLAADLVLAVYPVDLGRLAGVRLGFTDASPRRRTRTTPTSTATARARRSACSTSGGAWSCSSLLRDRTRLRA